MPTTSAVVTSAPTDLGAPSAGPAGTGRQGVRGRLVSALHSAAPALLIYVAIRALGLIVLAVAANRRNADVWDRLFHWDSEWFGAIAEDGYDSAIPPPSAPHGTHSNLAFFPVYPMAIRFLHTIFRLDIQAAGIAIAWVGGVVAAWGIYATANHLYGRRVGILAAALWGAMPIAIIQNMAYSESLFTALAAWALFAAVSRHWVWAGALAAVAGLTRANGVAVVAGVGVGALLALGRLYLAHRRGEPAAVAWWRPLIGGALAPLGWFGYLGWVGYRLGSWDGYFRVQDAWGPSFDGGVATTRALKRLVMQPSPFYLYLVAAIVISSLLLFAVCLTQRQAPELLAYSFMLLLIAVGDDAHFFCEARFLLPAFPLVFPVAAALARVRNRGTVGLLVMSCAAMSAGVGAYLLLIWPLWP